MRLECAFRPVGLLIVVACGSTNSPNETPGQASSQVTASGSSAAVTALETAPSTPALSSPPSFVSSASATSTLTGEVTTAEPSVQTASASASPPASGPSAGASTSTGVPRPEPTSVGESSVPPTSTDPALSLTEPAESLPPSDDPNRAMTIWIAGDSTVANGNTPCPTGWGKYLGESFNASTSIRNSGAGGRSVRTWMYNVSTEMGPDGECRLELDAQGNPTLQARWQEMLDEMSEGDALLIQFGINDGSPTCDRHVGVEAFKATYAVMVAAAKERGVQAVLITPTSSISCSGDTPRGTRGEYVDATLAIAEELGMPALDLHARTVARYGELGFCPVPGGDVSASTGGAVGDYFCDDHTHFSSTGAADVASLVAELLRAANVPFVSHLKENQ